MNTNTYTQESVYLQQEIPPLAKIFGDHLKQLSNLPLMEVIGIRLVAARNNGDSFIILDETEVETVKNSTLCDGEAPLLVLDGNKLYLFREFRNELNLAQKIAERLNAPSPAHTFSDEQIMSAFKQTPNEDQFAAVKNSLSGNFSIITGGPGTGKTTIIAALVALEYKRNPNIIIEVAAPTGKAAELLTAGLTAACPEYPIRAKTLHSLFRAVPGTGKFNKNSASPLECDLLIVDECSMISLDVAAKMFNGLPPQTRVVLSGDHRQLEAIGSGAVLSSLLTFDSNGSKAAGKLRSAGVELSINYRSKLAPAIQDLAKAIREKIPDAELCSRICSTASANYTFKTISSNTEREILDAAFEHWHTLPAAASEMTPESVKKAFGLLKSFRIITAMRVGKDGCSSLNQKILSRLGMNGCYSPGSALLITRNCRRTGLANGDVGIVFADKEKGGVKVWFENLPQPLQIHELPEHESAFAMTVHKAQGSGFKKVCFPMPKAENPLLTRELFYTALTRAELHIVIFGSPDSVMAALTRESCRMTRLAERTISYLQPKL